MTQKRTGGWMEGTLSTSSTDSDVPTFLDYESTTKEREIMISILTICQPKPNPKDIPIIKKVLASQRAVLLEHFNAVSDQSLARNPMFWLSHIRRIGRFGNSKTYRDILIAFKARLNRNRALKAQFLLLTSTEPLNDYWRVDVEMQQNCYEAVPASVDLPSDFDQTVSEELLDEKQKGRQMSFEEQTMKKFEALKKVEKKKCQKRLQYVLKNLDDYGKLQGFADWIFRPEDGIALKTRKYKKVFSRKNTFYGKEATDWLITNLNAKKREDAVKILSAMHAHGIINSVDNRKARRKRSSFKDSEHIFYSVARSNSSGGVFTCEGKECMMKCPISIGNPVTAVEVTIAVDRLDLQTFHFFKHTLNGTAFVQGQSLGLQSIVHPMRIFDSDTEDVFVDEVLVKKVFSSIAAPAMVSMHYYSDSSRLSLTTSEDRTKEGEEVVPKLIHKRGDNLFQDLGCVGVFHCINAIYQSDSELVKKYGQDNLPFIHTYKIIPTGTKVGLIEVVNGLTAFKDFDWSTWPKTDKIRLSNKQAKGQQEQIIANVVNSASGAYMAGYVIGVRDRHWDNIQIKDGDTLFHIDFGFVLGSQPPIDAPVFSISKAMTARFKELGCWDTFVDKCVDCFKCLRRRSAEFINSVDMMFEPVGWETDAIISYIQSNNCLMMNLKENEAAARLRKMVVSSATSWQGYFKQFSHKTVDPVFYGLLKKHFPPATIAMKVVDMKEEKKNAKTHKKVNNSSSNLVTLS